MNPREPAPEAACNCRHLSEDATCIHCQRRRENCGGVLDMSKLRTDGGLPETLESLAEPESIECIECGDDVDPRWIYSGMCPGCRHGTWTDQRARTDGGRDVLEELETVQEDLAGRDDDDDDPDGAAPPVALADGGQELVYQAPNRGQTRRMIHLEEDCRALKSAKRVIERPREAFNEDVEVCSFCTGEDGSDEPGLRGPARKLDENDPEDVGLSDGRLVPDGGEEVHTFNDRVGEHLEKIDEALDDQDPDVALAAARTAAAIQEGVETAPPKPLCGAVMGVVLGAGIDAGVDEETVLQEVREAYERHGDDPEVLTDGGTRAPETRPQSEASLSPAAFSALEQRVEEIEDELEKAQQSRTDLVAMVYELEDRLDDLEEQLEGSQ